MSDLKLRKLHIVVAISWLLLGFPTIQAQSFLRIAQQAFAKEGQMRATPEDSAKLPDIYIGALKNTNNLDGWLVAIQNLQPKPNLTKPNGLGATHLFLLGKMYQELDADLSDSLLVTAYNWFLELGEVEGQIYSLYELVFKAYAAGGYKLSPQIEAHYQQLLALRHQTSFAPAVVKAALAQINFQQINEQFYAPQQIDSLTLVLQSLVSEPYFEEASYGDFISALSIQSFYAQQPEKALEIALEAFNYSKKKDYALYTHAYNIGFLLGSLGRPKEALPYLFEARKNLGEVKTLYPAHMKVLIFNAIAGIYSDLNRLDSAYYFMTKCLHASRAHAALELNQKRIFAENRYQAQAKQLQLAKMDLLYAKKKSQNRWLIGASLVFALVALALYHLFEQRKVLEAKNKALAEQRARLVRVLAHDLSQPLAQFTEVATILAYLQAEGRVEEMETVKRDIKNSATALQNTLQNLAIWSQFYDHHTEMSTPKAIDICKLTESFVFLYTPLAAARGIDFQFACGNVGQLVANEIVLSHLLRNLVYNAAKHANYQTQIALEVGNSAEHIILKISNAADPEKAQRVLQIVERIASNPRNLAFHLDNAGLGFELIAEAVHLLQIKLYANFIVNGSALVITLHLPKKPI
jgi:signal transduction histidine kinase